MSYVCPVCSSPQADAEHLANHLAFTAMLRGDGHEEWLDEHAPEWSEQGPETLAPTVAEHVPETETELDHDHDDHGAEPSFERSLAQQSGYGRDNAPTDPEAERILAEAERMTEQMRAASEGEEEAETGDEEP